MNELVYIATPYSHPDPLIRQQRFEVVNEFAAELMRKGIHVYSPISHTHPIAMAGDLPKDWAFWREFDTVMIGSCSRMIVLCQDGWKDSVGVHAEIEIAENVGMPIEYVEVA